MAGMNVDYIKCGDCLELMKEIPDKSVDMVLCDLPFGTTAQQWDKVIPQDLLWEQYNRIITNNGSVVLFASGQFEPMVILSNLENYKYKWVWVKNNSTNFVHAKNRPMSKHESILVFSKAPMGHASLLGDKRMTYNPQGLIPNSHKPIRMGNNRFGTVAGKRESHLKPDETFVREYTNYPTDVLTDFPDISTNKKLHTNQKPVELCEYLIKTYTDMGGIVLDNCMGSGTTCVAAINTGRHYIGFEKEEKYFKIAEQRIKEAYERGVQMEL